MLLFSLKFDTCAEETKTSEILALTMGLKIFVPLLNTRLKKKKDDTLFQIKINGPLGPVMEKGEDERVYKGLVSLSLPQPQGGGLGQVATPKHMRKHEAYMP